MCVKYRTGRNLPAESLVDSKTTPDKTASQDARHAYLNQCLVPSILIAKLLLPRDNRRSLQSSFKQSLRNALKENSPCNSGSRRSSNAVKCARDRSNSRPAKLYRVTQPANNPASQFSRERPRIRVSPCCYILSIGLGISGFLVEYFVNFIRGSNLVITGFAL